jgi:hypothetical protein
MNTIAVYRAKLVLIRYTIVCAIIIAIGLIGTLNVAHAHVSVISDANGAKSYTVGTNANGAQHAQTEHIMPPDQTIPLAALLAGIGFGGVVVASALAGNLSRERSYLALVWTRPRTRTNEALTTIGVDLATIVVADVILLALVELGILLFNLFSGVHVGNGGPTPETFGTIAGMLGAAFMWYGIVAACTAPFAKAALSWIAWPVFFAIGAFYASHALRVFGLDPLMQALMYVNPVAYYPGNEALPTLLAWLIAALGCAAAVYGWSRKELTR